MKQTFLCVLLAAAIATAQDIQGPSISTENGDLRISTEGDMVFQAGDGRQIQFMTANGDEIPMQGQKGEGGDPGEAGRRGTNGLPGSKGEKGDQGERGPKGDTSGIIAWNECTWQNLNIGLDYGLLVSCRYNKMRNDTWLRLTWNGNMRITRCNTCCMRWFFTINGEECADPGPIDAVIFQSSGYHLVRQSTITGHCKSTGLPDNGTELTAGSMRVQFLVQDCPGFNGFVYDAYTGWNSVSRILIEEIMPRDNTFTEIAVHVPKEFVYKPHYCQYFYPHLDINRERNLGNIAIVKFNKEHEHTVLKITWEGNLRKKSCVNCCTRWWISIDGSQCSNYTQIETSIASSEAQDIFAPTTITGVCFASAGLEFGIGLHQIKLLVGNCPGSRISNAGSGFFSTSRLIVEEIPRPRDTLVNPEVYHPQWQHCVMENNIGGQDSGTLNATRCLLNKTDESSSLRVTFNGNIRLTGCSNCCMRWFITINGKECMSPAPIEAVIFSSNSDELNIHRGSTIAGICDMTSDGLIPTGNVEVLLNVGTCAGFNDSIFYNVFTGFQSPSTLNIEELPKTPNEIVQGSYDPIWTHCVTDTPLNATITSDTILGIEPTSSGDGFLSPSTDAPTTEPPPTSIQDCPVNKRLEGTVLKVAWDGNIAALSCIDCCVRWFITIDGQECSNPGPIDVAIRQDLSGLTTRDHFDLYRPASIVGICRGIVEGEQFAAGNHVIGLSVGQCSDTGDGQAVPLPADTLTGYNSVSRFIIEELPPQDDVCESQIIDPIIN